MSTSKETPTGWRELKRGEIIAVDDRIFTWDQGPWKDVGGSLIGSRYNVPNSDTDKHWKIIRKVSQHQ